MPPSAWVAWRKLLSCKQDSPLAVFDPKGTNNSIAAVDTTAPLSSLSKPPYPALKGNAGAHHVKKRRSTSSSVCCNDLKNVVHGNTRVVHREDQDSPPTHHQSHPQQLKTLISQEPSILLYSPRLDPLVHAHKSANAKKLSSCYDCTIASCELPDSLSPHSNSSYSKQSATLCPSAPCHKCGESVPDMLNALEEHNGTHHAVTELKEGDSARSIVEIILQSSWLRQDIPCVRPERTFKVHNSSKTIAKFEEYREMVKAKASKISKKHSRCLVDGNELLRFYGTTVMCNLGKTRSSMSSYAPSSSSLCSLSACGVCHILRHGFPTKGQPGIYTNASSGQAHESIMFSKDYDKVANAKRAMLVCRVIAGRVKKAGYESSQDGSTTGYDSAAGEAGVYTDLEELLVFNNRAVLPCFIVVYSC